MAADDRGVQREPFENVNQYTFSMIQHSLTEEMGVMDFDTPEDRTFLHWLYGLRANRQGLVGLIPEQMARMLADEPENVHRRLDGMQKCGHIYQDRLYVILTDWRRRMFGSEEGHGGKRWKRDDDGLVVLNKGMCRIALKALRTLTPDGRAVYLATCGMDEGGLRAKARVEQDQSKIKARSKQEQGKNRASAPKEEEEEEVEVEVEGGGTALAPSTTTLTAIALDPLAVALLHEFGARSADHEVALQGFCQRFYRRFAMLAGNLDPATAAKAAVELRRELAVWAEAAGHKPPYYLGNLTGEGFATYFDEKFSDNEARAFFVARVQAEPPATPTEPDEDELSPSARRAQRRRLPSMNDDLGPDKPKPKPEPAERMTEQELSQWAAFEG